MKKFAFFVSLLCVAGAASAHADSIVYDNSTANSFNSTALDVGPQAGFNYSVDSSFTIASAATIDQIMVGMWVQTGSNLTSLTGGIFTSPFGGGTELASFSGLPSSNTLMNSSFDFGSYALYEEYYDVSTLALSPGTYYLALLTGATDEGGQLAWDQSSNSNTSSDQWVTFNKALQNQYSDLSSTTFTLYGTGGDSTAPEPSNLILLGSGLAAMAALIRRRSRA